MCTTCGCAAGETRIEGQAVHEHDQEHWHVHADGTAHAHPPSGNAYRPANHAHVHRHADGTEHSHAHDHDGEHRHAHGEDHVHEAAGAVHMRKLKWKHWGAPKATGKGEFAQPMDQRDPWKPIRVKLRQPVERCGRTVYSRATFRVPGTHGRLGFPIWTC